MASLVCPNATLDDGWIQHPEVSGPRWLSTDVIVSTAERADHQPPSESDMTTPFTPHTVGLTPPFDDFGLVVLALRRQGSCPPQYDTARRLG